MVIVREFTGKMNLDSHPSKVGPRDYIDALNITRNAVASKDVNANIVGNRLVAYTLEDGTNECVGAFADERRNRVIACIYNSGGYHEIAQYDNATRTISSIVKSKTDTDGVDILNFSLTTRINDIQIIHRDSEGDLLFINDGLNKPIGLNISTIRNTLPITDDLIRLSKKPPLAVPTVEYASDASIRVNNHRKKLYQFAYRHVYKDGYKSVFSDYSKTPLPVDGYSTLGDADPTKNNLINVTVQAGGEDFQKIEIAFRECLGTVYSDFYLIDSFDRDDYSITPNTSFTYKFYNNQPPIPIPVRETEQIFDVIPDQANTMAVVNGNVLIFAGITEGYDQIPRSSSNVQVSYRLIDTSPNPVSSAGPPSLTWTTQTAPTGPTSTSYSLFLYVGPEVATGYKYHAGFISAIANGVQTTLNVEYAALSIDTRATVTQELRTLIDAALGPNFTVQIVVDAFTIRIQTNITPSLGGGYYNSLNVYATAASQVQGSSATWKHNSQFTLGLMYYDAYKKPLGIMSFRPIDGDPNIYSTTTPNWIVSAANGYAPQVPVLTGTISHAPVAGAKYFQWIRTKNQSVSDFLHYVTCKVASDDDFMYLCIENLDRFRENNSSFVPSYVFTAGDRVRVMCAVDNSSGSRYTETYYQDDYEILGEVQREITPAADPVPAVIGRWLKVAKPLSTSTYGTNQNLLIEVYTPAASAAANIQVFYQFGEVYPTYTHTNGNLYHTGNVNNQDDTQAAHFDFFDGDVYLKFRRMYDQTFSETLNIMQLSLMDANYSDNWNSAVNSDGRPIVLEPDMKREYDPALIRFSMEYLARTNINGLNRFFDDNAYTFAMRSYGDIQKLVVWDSTLVIMQKSKIGHSPIFQTILKNVSGQDVVESDELLGRIDYYSGQYGIGDAVKSVAYKDKAIYWWDNINGVNCRLAQNGIDAISKIYEAYKFGLTNAIAARKIVGVFDSNDSSYISSFAATQQLPAKTIAYNENEYSDRKGYVCFLSYQPEEIVCLNNLLISFKNGALWTHDSSTYNNFYGTQYDTWIEGVFNDSMGMKKTFGAVSYKGSNGWNIPEIATDEVSYGTTNQSTYINSGEFRYEEGYYHAAVGRDNNSTGKKSNGDYMKGELMTMKFRHTNANSFIYLLNAILKIAGSPKQPV